LGVVKKTCIKSLSWRWQLKYYTTALRSTHHCSVYMAIVTQILVFCVPTKPVLLNKYLAFIFYIPHRTDSASWRSDNRRSTALILDQLKYYIKKYHTIIWGRFSYLIGCHSNHNQHHTNCLCMSQVFLPEWLVMIFVCITFTSTYTLKFMSPEDKNWCLYYTHSIIIAWWFKILKHSTVNFV
jgi:hypothetical protein